MGSILPGVIGRSYSYGTFVEYPCCGGMAGLVPTRYLSDEFVTDVETCYNECQTVWTKVVVSPGVSCIFAVVHAGPTDRWREAAVYCEPAML